MRRAGWWARAIAAGTFWLLAYVYLTTPDVRPLRSNNPASTAFMRLRAREARVSGRPPRAVQRWVPYGRISGNLKRAVLAAEDSAFWQHEGIDFEQLRESMEVNLERMEFARGASTITQQLAKNLYLSPSKNPLRKLRELFITRRLEAVLTKQRILECYLNVIEWGDGIWGAEAAARAYFRKPASAVSAEEGALLAGAIVNPRLFSPAHPNARLLRRQRLVLRHMGLVTPPADPVHAAIPPAVPQPEAAPEPPPEAPPPPVEEPVRPPATQPEEQPPGPVGGKAA